MRTVALGMIMTALTGVPAVLSQAPKDTIGKSCVEVPRPSEGDSLFVAANDAGVIVCAELHDAFRGHKWVVTFYNGQNETYSTEAMARAAIARHELTIKH